MLTIEGLSKTFDPPNGLLKLLVRTAHDAPVAALSDVSLSVQPGEIVGLVGPNGAGKSTLIRICAGLLTATRGTVTIDGVQVGKTYSPAGRTLGLMLSDERALYWRLSGRENLRFFGVMAGLPSSEAARRADELLAAFGLAESDCRVFGYSSGMRVRLSLARSMIHRPRLLILDEPSRSLDPFASDELMATLRRLAGDGVAVLLASHRLDEIEAVGDRVAVLLGGRKVAEESISALAAGAGSGVRALLERQAGSSGEGSSS